MRLFVYMWFIDCIKTGENGKDYIRDAYARNVQMKTCYSASNLHLYTHRRKGTEKQSRLGETQV